MESQSVDIQQIEQIAIGTILANPPIYFQVSDFLIPAMFSGEILQDLSEKLFKDIEQHGTARLNAFAKKAQTENFSYLKILDLIKLSDIANFQENCESIKNAFISRNEIDFATKSKARLESGEYFEDVLSDVEAERGVLMSLVEKGDSDRVADFQNAMDEIYKAVEAAKSGKLTGITTGLRKVDKITSGWHTTDLIIVAARPAMGKSTLCFGYALDAARLGHPVLIFSLEMGKSQIIKKMISMVSGISSEKFRSGKLDSQELEKIEIAKDEVHALPIFIEDKVFDIDKISNKIRYYKQRHKVELVVLDYLQLCNRKGMTKEYEIVTYASKKCKQIAKSSDVAFIAISQLSRKAEDRGGSKKPQMSDLRSTGQIEQDADLIQFVYRPEYYDIFEDEEGQSLRGKAELIFAKNRHGMIDTIRTGFNGAFFDIKEPDYFEEEPSPAPNDFQQMRAAKSNEDDIPF